jgi:hypothetical protein
MYNNKKFGLFGKISRLILLPSNPGIGAWNSGFVGKNAALLVRQLVGEMLVVFFFLFPWS